MEDRNDIGKLKELLRDVDVCMLVTTDDKGKVTSRPMATVDIDEEGNVWFLTNEFSEKIHEASKDNVVSLIYAHPGKNIYVHINGMSRVILDTEKIKQLWTPRIQTWLPDGVEDPKLCILKISTQEAFYWSSSNKMETFFNTVRAMATGKTQKAGEEGKLALEAST